jgi:hypothetical protein
VPAKWISATRRNELGSNRTKKNQFHEFERKGHKIVASLKAEACLPKIK